MKTLYWRKNQWGNWSVSTEKHSGDYFVCFFEGKIEKRSIERYLKEMRRNLDKKEAKKCDT